MTGAMASSRSSRFGLRLQRCRILLLSMAACLLLVACRPEAALPDQADTLDVNEGRRYAFVINLSREWKPDWGGQLQFIDDATGAITDAFLPRWNSLSLFRVPQTHQVTLVSPWAARPRHAITGWWLAR